MSEREIIDGFEAIAEYLGVTARTVKKWIKVGRPEGKAIRKMGGKRFAFKDDLDAVREGKPEKIEA